MTNSATAVRPDARLLLNKVPEVTVWFWVIKILCTTVGESFADWINMTLGVGLVDTAVIFTVVFAVVLAVQLRTARYRPSAYWLTVVVVSVTGTLYTDILTDQLGVPLWISTTVFSVVLAGVFGVWYARERTLSIHSIVTLPRELFYWLAVLVTFALGTATGDWTLQLTGWGPGPSVLLPLGLIAVVTLLWRFGADAVLTFWVAYVLTRPLGANIGDWLATPSSEKGLGLGTFVTSVVFLAAILATVVFLSITHVDVTEGEEPARTQPPRSTPARRRVSLAVLAVAAVGTASLLAWADSRPHTDPTAEEGPAPSCASGAALTSAEAPGRVAAAFPARELAGFRGLAQRMLSAVRSGDGAAVGHGADQLESSWDDDQATLQPVDCQAWTYVDQQIDPVLSAVRAAHPEPSQEEATLRALLTTLG